MNKFFIIILLLFLVIAIIVPVGFFAWYYNMVKNDLENGKENLTQESNEEITGVDEKEMSEKCLTKYQDFLKNYGADYSKCLVDFDFKEDYCGGFDPETQGLADINMVVILDASGSMAERMGEEKRINIAKREVSGFLTKLPQGVNTGLVVYGHKGSNYIFDKEISCQGVEEVVKLGQNKYSDIIIAMNSFEPKGWTPIAGSLNFVKDIFSKKENGTNAKNYLILVSDGEESCDGNPITEAENLKTEIEDLNLIVIGLSADENAKASLDKIAKMGGGSYLTADKSSDIISAFNSQLLLIEKECLKMTFLKIAGRYKMNNLNNLNCWLDSYKKESNDFNENIVQKSFDQECNFAISKALSRRSVEYWGKRLELEEKNNTIYQKMETDLNVQLKALEK